MRVAGHSSPWTLAPPLLHTVLALPRKESGAVSSSKKRFLFVSISGLAGDIAWQVLKEGHDVRYFIANESERDIADGFVPKSEDWEKDVDGPTSSSSTTRSGTARRRPH